MGKMNTVKNTSMIKRKKVTYRLTRRGGVYELYCNLPPGATRRFSWGLIVVCFLFISMMEIFYYIISLISLKPEHHMSHIN